MRIFVCEFVTGGGLAGQDLPDGLCREGGMMLAALVKDLAELPGASVAVTRDRRLPADGLPAAVHWIGADDDPWAAWAAAIAAADAVWPIAPETGGILERLSAMVTAAGRILLASRPDAVRLAASKLATAAHLAAHGIATVPTQPLPAALAGTLPASRTGWVVKPDDGAGAEDTLLWRGAAALRDWAARRDDAGRFILQPYVPGAAGSLSLLCRDRAAVLLSCNSQDVRLDGKRLRYRGGTVGGLEAERPRLAPFADAIAAALPGLWGHAGVDVIMSTAGPVVVEINPRLTTSYAGLRAAIGTNPAAFALALRDGALPPPPAAVRPQHISVGAHVARAI